MKKLTILGVLVVSALGTLFHFTYQWVPIFIFPSNESIFEHMKLIVFPFLLYFLGCLFFYKGDKASLFSSFVSAILTSILVVIVSYYTYSGFIGKNIDVVNIILYYVSILVGFIWIYKKKTLVSFSNSIIFLLVLFILVVVFSFYPPNLSFFRG